MTETLANALRTLREDGHHLVLVTVGNVETPDLQPLQIERIPLALTMGGRPRRRRYARLVRAADSA
jgi:hypothetical protein